MANQASILIIDDEPQIRRLLKISLEANNYKVFQAETGKDGILQSTMVRPDIIILDLGLPDTDGLEVLKTIREWSSVPVITLSVRDSEADKIAMLDAGADDYLTKPFSTGELLARLRVALRHKLPMEESTIFKNGVLEVDFTGRLVKFNNEIVKLTTTEYSLLLLFIKHAGKVLTHNHILREIWGPTYTHESQYLRVFMAQLRKKIEENPAQPKMLVTESGVGYRMVIQE